MCAAAVTAKSNFNSSFDYQERVKELNEKLQDSKQKISLPSKIDLSFIGFEPAYADIKRKIIGLPSWFLFKYDDIPPRFIINDINDPRLVNDQFLDEFAAWINEKLRDSGISSVCRPDSYGVLQKLSLLLRDRDLFEKSKDFILCHELGHLLYSDKRNLSQGMIIIGIIAIVLSLVAIPLVISLTVGLTAGGIAIAITSLGISRFPTLSQLEQEKKADLDAATTSGGADGGIYYFKTNLMFNRRVRLQEGKNLLDFDEKGNFLKDKEHPPLADRVEYLRQWQKEQNAIRPFPILNYQQA